jgi:hypothetical protein
MGKLATPVHEFTFRVEFTLLSNGLTAHVDVVSTDEERALVFARNLLRLRPSWEVSSVKRLK